jgi:hypothetical protein
MLEGAEGLDDTARRYVDQIVIGSQRLDTLMDGLSRMGRIAAGRVSPTIESTHLQTAVDTVRQASENDDRLVVDPGADLSIRADQEWLQDAFRDVIDGLCFEPGLRLRLTWTHDAHDAQISFIPDSSFPMLDIDPEKANIGIALARMRIVAMGGSLDGKGDRVVITLPRG